MSKLILKKITLLNQVGVDSIDTSNKVKVLENFIETGIKILEADFGFVWYKFNKSDRYQLVYTSASLSYNPHYPRERGANFRVQHRKLPLFIKNVSRAKFLSADTKSHASSVAVIPIFHKQNTYGNMVFGYRKPYSFSAEDQTLAVALGNTAAQVLTIQKLLNQKDEFMGIVSHELRTPLTTVKGFTQLLQHRLIGTDKNNQYFLAKINSQIDRLSRLVRDLLEVSKIDSGKMTFNKTKIDLNELVKDITEDLQFTTDQHKLVLSGKVPGLVLADYDRLSQVLINIIMNAIKYSPRQKRVLIKLKKVDDNAVIMVQDFGIGISPQYQKKIFERFFQGNKIGPTAFPGLGLGLFISREIILRHQGNIWCVSRRGRGSKFFITLPIKNHNVQ